MGEMLEKKIEITNNPEDANHAQEEEPRKFPKLVGFSLSHITKKQAKKILSFLGTRNQIFCFFKKLGRKRSHLFS